MHNIQPVRLAVDGQVASLRAQPTTAPSGPATLDTVSRLDVLLIDGGEVSVTGQTRSGAALADRVGSRMPYVIGVVVLLSALLLVVAFCAPVIARPRAPDRPARPAPNPLSSCRRQLTGR